MDNLSQPHALAGPSQQPLQTCVRCPRKCLCDRCAQDLQPSTWRPALLTCWCCPPPSLPPWWCWGSWQRAIKKVKLVHVGHWQKSSHNFHTPIRLQENSARHADIWNTITSPCAGPHVPNIAGMGPYKARNNTPGCATAGSLLVVETSYSDTEVNSNTPSYILALYPSPKIEFMIEFMKCTGPCRSSFQCLELRNLKENCSP